jgi:hypothetical protein
MGTQAAERFAQLIDLDVPPLFLDGGDASMRPAVVLTAALRSAAHSASPAPLSADARLAMRQRLVAAASAPAEASLLSPGRVTSSVQRGQERAKQATHRLRRRLTAVVGSAVVVTSFAGVGVAAAHSLPGSPFYDIKRATEHVQLWLASGPAAKGERHLEFARTRLAEARALGGSSRYAASTLTAMNKETRAGSTDLLAAYRSSGSNEPLADLVSFTRSQYASLERFGETAPVKVQAQTFYSMTLLVGVAQDVRSISGTTCLTCILTGSKPHEKPTPASSASPSAVPGSTTPGSAGSHTPGRVLPTGILPSKLPTSIPTTIPTKLPSLPSLLPSHNGHRTKAQPKLSPLPVISAIKGLLAR